MATGNTGNSAKKTQLVQISPGNMKTGRIPAVSLTPVASCPKGIPCAKNCYACKICRYSPDARKAYARNLKLARTRRLKYFEVIATYLTRKKPSYFRWHVSGDILDQAYLSGMIALAKAYSDTKFLAFTKNHALDFSNLPSNLSIIFSMWNSWGDTSKPMPRARMRDSANPDPRIPATALECPGNCETCNACWALGKAGIDVVFNKH
jgi:hypothetical protein